MNGIAHIVFCIVIVLQLSMGVQGTMFHPAISSDGRNVTFASDAADLVSGDTNGLWDIFVYDRQMGTTDLISRDSAGGVGTGYSFLSSISADGRYVAFHSTASNLVPGDTNKYPDIFVRDRQTGTTALISRSSEGAEGNDRSFSPSISADGQYVTFESKASNLVTGDTNGGVSDIFVRDWQTGTTTLISRSSGGGEGNDRSFSPSISADGQYVAFVSMASNLVTGDTNGVKDIFMRDRQTGTTGLVSKSSTGVQGNDVSDFPSISADGRYVAFQSMATNLVSGDTNGMWDVFIYDRQTGTTTLISRSSTGVEGNGHSYEPSISADGRHISFDSNATNLVSGDTNGALDVFVLDQQTGTTTLISRSSAGVEGDGSSYTPSISADGRYVTFESTATNLVPGDTNGKSDVFVHDRQTGATTPVTITALVADFTGTPISGTKPLAVQFNDTSSGSPTSWSWDFGDGGTSTEQNPSYMYTISGNYTISLTATNPQGRDTKVKTRYIAVTAPMQYTFSMTNTAYRTDKNAQKGDLMDTAKNNCDNLANELKNHGWDQEPVFYKQGSAVTKADFNINPEAGQTTINSAVVHFHTGHGSEIDTNGRTKLALLDQNNDVYSFDAFDVTGKWGGNNKWVILDSCYLLQDEEWGNALDTSHGVMGFITQVAAPSGFTTRFVKYAIDDKNTVYLAYRKTTYDLLKDSLVPEHANDVKDSKKVIAAVFFKDYNQVKYDYLPGVKTGVYSGTLYGERYVKNWTCDELPAGLE